MYLKLYVSLLRCIKTRFHELTITSLQVKYCNKNGIEFLAYNTGHGSTATLGKFNSVQINLSKLNNITIEPDGKSAWLQGGTHAGLAIEYLWDNGYVTTTGACDCVGFVGAGLGGSHGRLKGLYRMVLDNIIQLNIMLANSSTIRINTTSYNDLYQALRGAGHNFSIIISIETNLYPRRPPTWFYKNYIQTGDKLNNIFTAINILH